MSDYYDSDERRKMRPRITGTVSSAVVTLTSAVLREDLAHILAERGDYTPLDALSDAAVSELALEAVLRTLVSSGEDAVDVCHSETTVRRDKLDIKPFRYTADYFVPEDERMTAEKKAEFINKLFAFVDAGCPRAKFTKALYHTLHMDCGHIAHYNADGFYYKWFDGECCQHEWMEYHARMPLFFSTDHARDLEFAITLECQLRLGIMTPEEADEERCHAHGEVVRHAAYMVKSRRGELARTQKELDELMQRYDDWSEKVGAEEVEANRSHPEIMRWNDRVEKLRREIPLLEDKVQADEAAA